MELQFHLVPEMHQFVKFILFCSSTLHVSDGLSVHYQESKTVHKASGISSSSYSTTVLLVWPWLPLQLMLPASFIWFLNSLIFSGWGC
jgi:hypothetical protein